MKRIVLLALSLLMLFGITASAAEDRYIIKFNDSVQFFDADGETNNKDYLSVSADELQDYIDAGVVEFYGPDFEVELYAATWNLDSIKLDFPHYIGCAGSGVRIGVIDSGIVDGIAPNVIPGYNYIDDNTDTSDDDTLHGTLVSGIAAISPCGVALGAQFVPLKCFRNKTANLSLVMDAIVDAVDMYDCDVINMSMGIAESEFTTPNDYAVLNLFKSKIDYAVSKGAILVAAAGNNGDSTINYPAAFNNVIGVGSVNQEGVRSSFSNFNNSVHVVAPGEKVWGPYISDGEISTDYVYVVNGTSFSAPHVSGLAAIARSIKPDITSAEFAQLIADTAVETTSDTVEGWDVEYGYGLIDCEAAIKKLIEGQIIHISPVWFNANNANAVLYNNTEESKKILTVCVYYDEDGRMTECNTAEVEIDAYNTFYFPNPRKGGTIKYMGLSDDGKLMPLALSKEKYDIPTDDVPTGELIE